MFNVLFLCTGNSARSILAEALINHQGISRQRFRGFSAGSHPKGQVHPMALEVLQANGIPVDGLRSKGWEEFSGPDAPRLDFVFTVCDQAAAEACPVWPGHPVTAHWGIPDPAAVEDPVERRRAFLTTFHVLRRRIDLFAALSVENLSSLALQERLNAIAEVVDPRDTADQAG